MSKDNSKNDTMYEQLNYNYYYPPVFRYPSDEECDSNVYDDRQGQPE